MHSLMTHCDICPRNCGANRQNGTLGTCRSKDALSVARAALHMWEEPCISGENGSGTVFFTGCNLGCVYCQNAAISRGNAGTEITQDRLVEIFFELKDQGAHNINLVTPTHFLPSVLAAIKKAKDQAIGIPFIYNCGGYEKVEMLKHAEGLIDIYLPDFKYMSSALSLKYSYAPNYAQVAKAALCEMVRQKPECVFDENGLMSAGVMVRHMMLPGQLKDAKAVVAYLLNTYGDSIYLSIMQQYTPPKDIETKFPELCQTVGEKEYEKLIDYAISIGCTNAFVQEGGAASDSFIPNFDGFGVNMKGKNV